MTTIVNANARDEIRTRLQRGENAGGIAMALSLDAGKVAAERRIMQAEFARIWDDSSAETRVISVLKQKPCAFTSLCYVAALSKKQGAKIILRMRDQGIVETNPAGSRVLVSLVEQKPAGATSNVQGDEVQQAVHALVKALEKSIEKSIRASLK